MDQIYTAKLEEVGLSEEKFRRHFEELKSSGIDSFRINIRFDNPDTSMLLALLEDYRENGLNLSDIDSYLMLRVFENNSDIYKQLYGFMDGRYKDLLDGNAYLVEDNWDLDNGATHVTERIHSIADIKKGTMRNFLKFHGKDFSFKIDQDRFQLIKNAILREGFILENELEDIFNEIGMSFL